MSVCFVILFEVWAYSTLSLLVTARPSLIKKPSSGILYSFAEGTLANSRYQRNTSIVVQLFRHESGETKNSTREISTTTAATTKAAAVAAAITHSQI